jgi:hypothetical protein
MINRLIGLIGKEANTFEDFLGLLEQQQQALVKNDRDALNSVTDLQREKLVESQLLNSKREDLVRQIQSANAIEGDVNVSRLLGIVDKDQGRRLTDLRKIISDLNDKITETRNQNAILLNKSRSYIQETLERLSRLNQTSNGYANDGTSSEQGSVIAVDRRA